MVGLDKNDALVLEQPLEEGLKPEETERRVLDNERHAGTEKDSAEVGANARRTVAKSDTLKTARLPEKGRRTDVPAS